jgi:hypothetical protein
MIDPHFFQFNPPHTLTTPRLMEILREGEETRILMNQSWHLAAVGELVCRLYEAQPRHNQFDFGAAQAIADEVIDILEPYGRNNIDDDVGWEIRLSAQPKLIDLRNMLRAARGLPEIK